MTEELIPIIKDGQIIAEITMTVKSQRIPDECTDKWHHPYPAHWNKAPKATRCECPDE